MLACSHIPSPPLLTLLGRMNPRPGKINSKELHYQNPEWNGRRESRAYA